MAETVRGFTLSHIGNRAAIGTGCDEIGVASPVRERMGRWAEISD